jgi:hypothetical protein
MREGSVLSFLSFFCFKTPPHLPHHPPKKPMQPTHALPYLALPAGRPTMIDQPTEPERPPHRLDQALLLASCCGPERRCMYVVRYELLTNVMYRRLSASHSCPPASLLAHTVHVSILGAAFTHLFPLPLPRAPDLVL